MKKIINKRTKKTLTIEEAKLLTQLIKNTFQSVQIDYDMSITLYGCETAANLHQVQKQRIISRENYIFAFLGAEYVPASNYVTDSCYYIPKAGYRSLSISLPSLPKDFSEKFPNYEVVDC